MTRFAVFMSIYRRAMVWRAERDRCTVGITLRETPLNCDPLTLSTCSVLRNARTQRVLLPDADDIRVQKTMVARGGIEPPTREFSVFQLGSDDLERSVENLVPAVADSSHGRLDRDRGQYAHEV